MLRGGTRLLDMSRKDVILRIAQQKTRQQARDFLGAIGFCRIWILGYFQMVQPLYELLTGPERDSLNWNGRGAEASHEIKKRCTEHQEIVGNNP